MRRAAILGVLVLIVFGVSCTTCSSYKRYAYSGFGRDRWQQPERVVEALGLEPGDRVADLGSGGGYFTLRLATAVGPEGTVWAVDVDEGMLDLVAETAEDEGYRNVTPVLAAYDDPRLPAGSVDLIFTCNTYHHLDARTDYFERVRHTLRPDGRVAIVEHRPRGFFQRIFPHSTSAAEIRSEMEAAGYRLERRHTFLDRQSFMVFAPDPAAASGASP